MILLIDNYDSFTFNLVQALGALSSATEIRVERSDNLSLADIHRLHPTSIILSPGPCTPREAGVCVDAVREFGPLIPILGVCLGHQCIGAAFGMPVLRAPRLMHGKTSDIHHHGDGLFHGLPSPFRAARYHSLLLRHSDLPPELEATAWTNDGELMGLRHRSFPLCGVQFHPESFLTQHGSHLLANFLELSTSPAPGASRLPPPCAALSQDA